MAALASQPLSSLTPHVAAPRTKTFVPAPEPPHLSCSASHQPPAPGVHQKLGHISHPSPNVSLANINPTLLREMDCEPGKVADVHPSASIKQKEFAVGSEIPSRVHIIGLQHSPTQSLERSARDFDSESHQQMPRAPNEWLLPPTSELQLSQQSPAMPLTDHIDHKAVNQLDSEQDLMDVGRKISLTPSSEDVLGVGGGGAASNLRSQLLTASAGAVEMRSSPAMRSVQNSKADNVEAVYSHVAADQVCKGTSEVQQHLGTVDLGSMQVTNQFKSTCQPIHGRIEPSTDDMVTAGQLPPWSLSKFMEGGLQLDGNMAQNDGDMAQKPRFSSGDIPPLPRPGNARGRTFSPDKNCEELLLKHANSNASRRSASPFRRQRSPSPAGRSGRGSVQSWNHASILSVGSSSTSRSKLDLMRFLFPVSLLCESLNLTHRFLDSRLFHSLFLFSLSLCIFCANSCMDAPICASVMVETRQFIFDNTSTQISNV